MTVVDRTRHERLRSLLPRAYATDPMDSALGSLLEALADLLRDMDCDLERALRSRWLATASGVPLVSCYDERMGEASGMPAVGRGQPPLDLLGAALGLLRQRWETDPEAYRNRVRILAPFLTQGLATPRVILAFGLTALASEPCPALEPNNGGTRGWGLPPGVLSRCRTCGGGTEIPPPDTVCPLRARAIVDATVYDNPLTQTELRRRRLVPVPGEGHRARFRVRNDSLLAARPTVTLRVPSTAPGDVVASLFNVDTGEQIIINQVLRPGSAFTLEPTSLFDPMDPEQQGYRQYWVDLPPGEAERPARARLSTEVGPTPELNVPNYYYVRGARFDGDRFADPDDRLGGHFAVAERVPEEGNYPGIELPPGDSTWEYRSLGRETLNEALTDVPDGYTLPERVPEAPSEAEVDLTLSWWTRPSARFRLQIVRSEAVREVVDLGAGEYLRQLIDRVRPAGVHPIIDFAETLPRDTLEPLDALKRITIRDAEPIEVVPEDQGVPAGVATEGQVEAPVLEAEGGFIGIFDVTRFAFSRFAEGRTEVQPPSDLQLFAGLPGGTGSADGVGASARFMQTWGLALDGGRLYVADAGNHTVRQLDLATGAVTTLAGSSGVRGSSDGLGTNARFNTPQGLATNDAGILYVADSSNHAIRQIDLATGMVTTLAGSPGTQGTVDGTGTSARFRTPQALVWDRAGLLYVADTANHTIRQIDLVTRTVSTLAGSAGSPGSSNGVGTAARFNQPQGLALDDVGRLFVCDTNNHMVRRITLAGAMVETFAGAGTPGYVDGVGTGARFNFPRGVISDGSGRLVLMDANNHAVRRIDLASAAVDTLAGLGGTAGAMDGVGAVARFNTPQGATRGDAGTVYVADTLNATIRSLTVASGGVATIAGTPSIRGTSDGLGTEARFFAPGAMAHDGTDRVYVCDTSNHTVRRIELATGIVTTLAGGAGSPGVVDGLGTSARFNRLDGVTYDGSDRLYVADTGNHTLRRIDLATGAVSTVAGSAGQFGSTDGIGAGARFSSPSGVAYDGAGRLYVADAGNHTLRQIVLATGAVSTLAGRAASPGTVNGVGSVARFNGPYGLVFVAAGAGSGTLVVSERFNASLRVVALDTGAVTTLAGLPGTPGSVDGTGTAARFSTPMSVVYDGQGRLYVADATNHVIRRVDLATGAVTTVVGSFMVAGVQPERLAQARLNNPSGLVWIGSGRLLVSDTRENCILRVRGA